MAEHVIFRHDPDHQPQLAFRGVPSGCAGGANTLAEARASYRMCLCERLHVDRRELPPIVEHIEGLVGGMWVRTRVGAVHRDTSSDRMLLQILLTEQTGLHEEVARLAALGAEPVVVLAEPDYVLETLLDQMSTRDALVVAHSDDNGSVGWSVLYGSESSGSHGVPPAMDDEHLRATPVATFTQACTSVGRVVQRRAAADIAS
ncbi:hypothetical protein [Mycolicibacterium aichiense]|uniref:Uncharacterized protein n=1 Tax=Mycolicibacterium aichiense TaxID=1799 RepID=A0AAD1HKG8_9MYCO|nr:hypothetical protein [Mycolicibacterium aichiense]MCV7018109.1 hypothetical protein [Mycolicibacterium aichiense]BBX07060.1 hypothetical protein MAIC_18630 [Mycolicibacterium aichiense]STZ80876.1 Uncharacterised protein [Mycolicibacterium aichiense]